jgi:hypothetical protein
MRLTSKLISLPVAAIACGVGLSVTPVCGAERTTPVTVKNLLGIDPNNNTVKAQQLGAWNVNITGSATVTQSGSWSVGLTGSPNVTIANSPSVTITNTPNVSVANIPTVKIDSTTNSVATPTQRKAVQLWTSDQVVAPPSGQVTSPSFDCVGYKQMYIIVKCTQESVSPTLVKVFLQLTVPTTSQTFSPGYANFTAPSGGLSGQATFVQSLGICMFSFPVIADQCRVLVQNQSTSSVTIDSARSWVYLVN